MAGKKILKNTKTELTIVLQRLDELRLSKNKITKIMKGTKSVTSSSTSSTHQKIPRTSSKVQKKSTGEPNPVHIPEKSVMIKKKISTTVLKSNNVTIQSSKPKSPSGSKFHTTANKLKEKKFDGTVKKHKCADCGKGFSRRSHLVDHTYTHSGEKPHKCYYCDHPFTSKSNLAKHVRIHTGVKPFVCKVCEKQFTLKKNMIDHERTHSGEKPYECTLCKKRFGRYSASVRHLRIHTEEKYLECNECLEIFALKLNLQWHITAKHLNDKSWRPRGCNDVPQKDGTAVLQPIQPVCVWFLRSHHICGRKKRDEEIAFVDCENYSGDNLAMHSDITEDSPIDDTNLEIKEEGEELAGSSKSLLYEEKKRLVVVIPVITSVFSLAGDSATPAQMNPTVLLSNEDEMTQHESENTCRELCVTLERMKILPIKKEEN